MSEQQVAIVTGASRGIGRAICKKLASKGIHIVLNYTANEDAAKETQRMCELEGVRVQLVKADVSKPRDCEYLIEQAKNITGKIDILVNNAGITRDSLLIRAKCEDFEAVINTNLAGTFYCMKLVTAIMLRQRSGKIVNMSSVIGIHGNAGQVVYSASKAGIIGMTKSLAKEVATKGITVNAVAPGMIMTDMTKILSEQTLVKIKSEIPMGFAGGPEDIANAVAFLVSDEARYITGQVLSVDGGMAI